MYINVQVYIRWYTYVHMGVSGYIPTCPTLGIWIYVHNYPRIYTLIHACTHRRIWIYTPDCPRIYAHVHVCTHIHIPAPHWAAFVRGGGDHRGSPCCSTREPYWLATCKPPKTSLFYCVPRVRREFLIPPMQRCSGLNEWFPFVCPKGGDSSTF